MYYSPIYFQVHELVHPNIYKKFGDLSLMFLDANMLWTIDQLRIRYGSATINNYFWKGSRIDSGLRDITSTTGSPYSLHRFGKAFDLIFKNITAEEIRQDIIKNPNDEIFKHIKRVEWKKRGVPISWLHIDSANINNNRIYFFNV